MKQYELIKDYPLVQKPCMVKEDINGKYVEQNGFRCTVRVFSKEEIENFPEFWQEIKEIMVRIDKFEILEENVNWVGKPELIKKFETNEAAEKWIDQNKPVFSKKQVLEAIKNNRSSNHEGYLYELSFVKELGL